MCVALNDRGFTSVIFNVVCLIRKEHLPAAKCGLYGGKYSPASLSESPHSANYLVNRITVFSMRKNIRTRTWDSETPGCET